MAATIASYFFMPDGTVPAGVLGNMISVNRTASKFALQSDFI